MCFNVCDANKMMKLGLVKNGSQIWWHLVESCIHSICCIFRPANRCCAGVLCILWLKFFTTYLYWIDDGQLPTVS